MSKLACVRRAGGVRLLDKRPFRRGGCGTTAVIGANIETSAEALVRISPASFAPQCLCEEAVSSVGFQVTISLLCTPSSENGS